MSLVAKLTLERPKISDDGNVPDDLQKSNTSDSEAFDDVLDNTVEDAEEITESDDQESAEQTEQATETVQAADQASEFGQPAPAVEADEIVTEIFTRTKVLVTHDDPLVMMIQLVRQEFADARSDIKSFVFAEMMDNLGMHTAAVKDEIKAVHNDYAKIIIKHTETVKEATDQALSDFSKEVEETVKILTTQLDEVRKTTKVLENQKQFIVNDVYGKLNEKILKEVKENLTSELKRIAQNENNKVNQHKNMLIGGMAGLFVGMIFAVLIGAII